MTHVPGLTEQECDLIAGVLRAHPEILRAKVFGSRAKGTHKSSSDVDLAIWGLANDVFAQQKLASELDELPLPYQFEVKAFERIRLHALRDHIERRGITIFEATSLPPAAPG